ncbi:hypothetical protein FDP41_012129 [Naegleria fowleri]|uniref:Uncharacterized protein n=1 Tax=Naegleria fowleri TaxID=5763 RepID=A0A6A5C3Z7_NAEFO|nr:uncharacterized protein FDP41_012129 [Naegleria fowleri]KAF0981472.1 hypothetical protein FDP41_012129 [Naegleria fowleri]
MESSSSTTCNTPPTPTPTLQQKSNNNGSESEKKKKFTKQDLEKLKQFFEFNDKQEKPLLLTKCFEAFAKEYGFTPNQVKGNFYKYIRLPNQSMQSSGNEIASSPQKKKQKKELLSNVVLSDDVDTDDEKSCSTSSITTTPTKPVHPVSVNNDDLPTTPAKHHHSNLNVFNQESFFIPWKFESSTGRIYVYRYPSHFKFKTGVLNKKKKMFMIEVTCESRVTISNLQEIGEELMGKNIVEVSERPLEKFTIVETIENDVDLSTMKCGPRMFNGERFYMVFIEKKQEEMIPVKEIDWESLGASKQNNNQNGSLFLTSPQPLSSAFNSKN